jgi:hypothetical protein
MSVSRAAFGPAIVTTRLAAGRSALHRARSLAQCSKGTGCGKWASRLASRYDDDRTYGMSTVPPPRVWLWPSTALVFKIRNLHSSVGAALQM